MISHRLRVAVALGLLTCAGCATLPPAETRPSLEALAPVERARAEANLAVFNSVWDLVSRKHFDVRHNGVDWSAAAGTYAPRAAAADGPRELYAVINAMLEPLRDSHTRALTPEQAEERRTRVRARTGFNLLKVEGRWVVGDVLPGSPAEEVGVRRGWLVIARNGQPLGDRLDFRYRPGEVARWEFRDAQDRSVEVRPVARLLSMAPRQEARTLEGGVVYLRFDGFDAVDRRWLSDRLKENASAPAVIVDLRHNSGGDTFSLGTVIGEFFERRVDCGTFITRSGDAGVKRSWQWGSAAYRGRVVLLIDAETASAAEIFAAVMRDQGRAVLVGRKTAGAVLASTFHTLPDGGQLQLSREDYVTPRGQRIEGVGVEPSVPVALALADLRAGRDRDLEQALETLASAR